MATFIITTNYEERIVTNVTQESIRKRMLAYIQEEMKKGKTLSQIKYTYCPVRVHHKLP